MEPNLVRQVRSFNRAVTQQVGALNDQFLGRGRPLGECRLLYEIGHEGAEIRRLRSRLELDSGYLSPPAAIAGEAGSGRGSAGCG